MFVYQGKSGVIYECILSKRERFGLTTYKCNKAWTSGLIDYNGEWNVVNKQFEYAFINNDRGIEGFDTEGYEPIATKITWYLPDGSYHYRWVYVIDKSNPECIKND